MPGLRLTSLLALCFVATTAAHAQIAGDKVKIGVLTDLSGAYETASGAGSVEGARMAAEEFGWKVNGKPIEILSGDHQNKPDLGAAIANRWFDIDKVDSITDLVNSSVAFAVLDIAKQKNKTLLLTSAGSADFTGKACAPDNVVHWVYDTYEIGNSIGRTVKQLGNKWFLLSVDYIFGRLLEESVRGAVERNGGTVVGSLRHPLGTSDFSSYIMQAKASGADVVAILNGGDDTINAIKTAKEFGLFAKQKVMPNLDSLQSTKSVGLEIAQGLLYVSAWEPNLTPESRAFMEKFIERRKVAPGPFHVGTYSVVRTYLKAVEAANSTDPKTVIAKMREMKIHDAFTDNGHLRPDGRMVHDVYLVQVKIPAESTGEWDLVKPVATIRGDDAFRPLAEGGCPALATR
jgi:branched-chain amino acid transport system substrate-binding protein